MRNFARSAIAQELRVMKSIVAKIRRLIYRPAAQTTVRETLYRHAIGIEFAQQLDGRGDKHTFGIVSERVVDPHTIEFAHPRFRVRVREQVRFRVLHIAVHGDAQTIVGRIGSEYPEIVLSEPRPRSTCASSGSPRSTLLREPYLRA